jgi:hypothetical protein
MPSQLQALINSVTAGYGLHLYIRNLQTTARTGARTTPPPPSTPPTTPITPAPFRPPNSCWTRSSDGSSLTHLRTRPLRVPGRSAPRHRRRRHRRPGRPGRPAPGPDQADRDRAELPDPRTRTAHPDPADTAAAMRARIRARFADLHHEREQIEAQLQGLAKTTPAAADPALPDQLPLTGDILGLPPTLKARLFAALAWKSCGTNPASKSPCTSRSPRTPSMPSPASPTPARTATTTPAPSPTTAPQPAPMWDLTSAPARAREQPGLCMDVAACRKDWAGCHSHTPIPIS